MKNRRDKSSTVPPKKEWSRLAKKLQIRWIRKTGTIYSTNLHIGTVLTLQRTALRIHRRYWVHLRQTT